MSGSPRNIAGKTSWRSKGALFILVVFLNAGWGSIMHWGAVVHSELGDSIGVNLAGYTLVPVAFTVFVRLFLVHPMISMLNIPWKFRRTRAAALGVCVLGAYCAMFLLMVALNLRFPAIAALKLSRMDVAGAAICALGGGIAMYALTSGFGHLFVRAEEMSDAKWEELRRAGWLGKKELSRTLGFYDSDLLDPILENAEKYSSTQRPTLYKPITFAEFAENEGFLKIADAVLGTNLRFVELCILNEGARAKFFARLLAGQ